MRAQRGVVEALMSECRVLFLSLACAASCWGGFGSGGSLVGLQISEGVAHHQVLQRDARNSASLRMSGLVSEEAAGTFYARYARVSGKSAVLRGFAGVPAGMAAAGRWQPQERRSPSDPYSTTPGI